MMHRQLLLASSAPGNLMTLLLHPNLEVGDNFTQHGRRVRAQRLVATRLRIVHPHLGGGSLVREHYAAFHETIVPHQVPTCQPQSLDF